MNYLCIVPILSFVTLAISSSPCPIATADEPFLEQQDLFVSGDGQPPFDNFNNYYTYHVPAMIVSAKGTVLVFCEGRKTSTGDAGDLDLLLRRSFDGGKTFEPIQLVHEEGGAEKITIGNPCPVVDAEGTIHLLFCRNTSRVYHRKSTDDGETFSEPIEITQVFYDYRDQFPWTRAVPGPGHGLLTRNGRLVMPMWINDRSGHNYRSVVIYSDDNGATWMPGGIVPPDDQLTSPYNNDLCECSIVEAADGSLLLNMRVSNHRRNKVRRRAVAASHDGGISWSQPTLNQDLVSPVCHAVWCRYSFPEDDQPSQILFSNPATTSHRVQMTVKLSYDEGKTWPVARELNAGASTYSDLAIADDKTILCIYHNSENRRTAYPAKLTLARFNLEWLTGGNEDNVAP